MRIELKEIFVRDLYDGYCDNNDDGVVGYGGNLNIRPAYQREFIYGSKAREAVIRTVINHFPLNVMYWVKSGNGEFELLDGQQRTISICQYLDNNFSVDHRYFSNLTQSEKDNILDYKLMIYICEGNDKEKLDWFRVINTNGDKLNSQEMKNAIYAGEWLTEAKRYFSKNDCPAKLLANPYMKGAVNRQDYLETALNWISARDGKEIEDYMSEHQHDKNCNELWLYFQNVISWVKVIFPNYRKEMNGLSWGIYYNKFHCNDYDAKELEQKIVELMEDEEVTNTRGIYEYLLDGDERHLSLRAFPIKISRMAYEKQKGYCARCGRHFEFKEMQADHITPWSKGGQTIADNCQMLCADCNRRKSNI